MKIEGDADLVPVSSIIDQSVVACMKDEDAGVVVRVSSIIDQYVVA